MNLTVREPDLVRVDDRGIPLDFLASMELFNRLLANNKLPNIPRKSPITANEIRRFWMPNPALTYLGFDEAKLLASGTLLQSSIQNAYSQDSGRETEYSLIFQPGSRDIAQEVTRAVLRDAKLRGLTFVLHTSENNTEEMEIMYGLGHAPTHFLNSLKRYEEAGINGGVFVYIIHPNNSTSQTSHF